MWKKLLIVFCLFCLTGCASGTPHADYQVELVYDLDYPVYGIHQEYSVEGQQIGGGNCIRADNEAFSKGESVFLSYLPEDFKEDMEGRTLTIKVYASGEGNSETYLGTIQKTVRFGTAETMKLSEIK